MIRRMNDLQNYLKTLTKTANAALEALLPSAQERPIKLHEAMRYSVLTGGKRLRPALCIAACEACGGTVEQAMPAACALEFLHTYTLIHDDLPAMDDDTLRRGRPTCHIQFDEATAILAGDALLTLAFEVLATQRQGGALALELARAAGSRGVIGGQMEDVDAEGKTPDTMLVEYIHRNKTASLIRAACVMGGICAGANVQTLEKLAQYGENAGLAFQLADDLLDESATVEELGKDIGSDKAKGKMTWPAVHGIEKTVADAKQLEEKAVASLQGLKDSVRLEQLVAFIIHRNS
jgi:geranylgeranyl pyrophosphate synthase